MNHLIDAFEGLFTAASKSGGDLAKTAGFVLENVNWEGKPEKPRMLRDTADRYDAPLTHTHRLSRVRSPDRAQ